MDQIVVPAGTVVRINGMPFELSADTPMLGTEANYRLASSQSEASFCSPYDAHGSPVTSSTSNRED